MQFQQNDIIKDGVYYRTIFGVDGNRVNMGYPWSTALEARENPYSLVYSSPLSETKDWIVVERDGKPFVEKPWEPADQGKFWTVDFQEEENVYEWIWCRNNPDYENLGKRQLIFRTKEEATACAQKMLEAIKK